MDRMHILYVTSEFILGRDKGGGLASFIANIAEIFAGHGHLVTIMIISKQDKELKWKENIKLVYFDPIKSNKILDSLNQGISYQSKYQNVLMKLFYSLRGRVIRNRIIKLHKESKIDIIQFTNLQCLAYKVMINIPSLVRISSFPGLNRQAQEDLEFSIGKAVKKISYQEKLELLSIREAPCIITPSEFSKRLIWKTIRKEATVIESPFYCDNIVQDNDIYKKDFKDKKYFLYYGRLGYLKGTHILARAVYDLLDKYPDYYLVLIGSDNKMTLNNGKIISAYKYVKICAKQYADRVIYKEFLLKHKLLPIIKAAEICLFPSRVDNLPNTCIEAMGLGKVVVGTRGASFEQLIEDGESGFLCKKESPKSLLACIDRYMNLSGAEKMMISNNAKKRINDMEPNQIYFEYLNIYKEQIRLQNLK